MVVRHTHGPGLAVLGGMDLPGPITLDPGLGIVLVMEQHLGHGSHAANLERALRSRAGVRLQNIDVRYAPSSRRWDRRPVPGAIRAALRGRTEARGARDAAGDVVFFNTQVPAALAGRWLRERPYVLSVDITPRQYDRAAEAYGHRRNRSRAAAVLKHRHNERLFAGAAHIVAWSDWVRRSLLAEYGVAPDRVTVIPPGVDTSWWAPAAPRSGGPIRVLFVGGDFVRKGGPDLMTAFRSLPVGSAELVLVTKTKIPEERGVRVVGNAMANSAQLLDLFRSSDVFVLPSRAEAFGIAAVEAAAAGLPAVVTRVGGLSEIVLHDRTGVVVEPGHIEGLRAALDRLRRDGAERARFGVHARARAESHFDADRNATKLLALLRGLT